MENLNFFSGNEKFKSHHFNLRNNRLGLVLVQK